MADRGRKARPATSPLLEEKWRARDFELHRNAVKTAKSGTDSTAPLAMSMTHVRPGNAKQTYFKELKEKAISQENARLIGEIQKIQASDARNTSSAFGGSTLERPLYRSSCMNQHPGISVNANHVPMLDNWNPHVPGSSSVMPLIRTSYMLKKVLTAASTSPRSSEVSISRGSGRMPVYVSNTAAYFSQDFDMPPGSPGGASDKEGMTRVASGSPRGALVDYVDTPNYRDDLYSEDDGEVEEVYDAGPYRGGGAMARITEESSSSRRRSSALEPCQLVLPAISRSSSVHGSVQGSVHGSPPPSPTPSRQHQACKADSVASPRSVHSSANSVAGSTRSSMSAADARSALRSFMDDDTGQGGLRAGTSQPIRRASSIHSNLRVEVQGDLCPNGVRSPMGSNQSSPRLSGVMHHQSPRTSGIGRGRASPKSPSTPTRGAAPKGRTDGREASPRAGTPLADKLPGSPNEGFARSSFKGGLAQADIRASPVGARPGAPDPGKARDRDNFTTGVGLDKPAPKPPQAVPSLAGFTFRPGTAPALEAAASLESPKYRPVLRQRPESHQGEVSGSNPAHFGLSGGSFEAGFGSRRGLSPESSTCGSVDLDTRLSHQEPAGTGASPPSGPARAVGSVMSEAPLSEGGAAPAESAPPESSSSNPSNAELGLSSVNSIRGLETVVEQPEEGLDLDQLTATARDSDQVSATASIRSKDLDQATATAAINSEIHQESKAPLGEAPEERSSRPPELTTTTQEPEIPNPNPPGAELKPPAVSGSRPGSRLSTRSSISLPADLTTPPATPPANPPSSASPRASPKLANLERPFSAANEAAPARASSAVEGAAAEEAPLPRNSGAAEGAAAEKSASARASGTAEGAAAEKPPPAKHSGSAEGAAATEPLTSARESSVAEGAAATEPPPARASSIAEGAAATKPSSARASSTAEGAAAKEPHPARVSNTAEGAMSEENPPVRTSNTAEGSTAEDPSPANTSTTAEGTVSEENPPVRTSNTAEGSTAEEPSPVRTSSTAEGTVSEEAPPARTSNTVEGAAAEGPPQPRSTNTSNGAVPEMAPPATASDTALRAVSEEDPRQDLLSS